MEFHNKMHILVQHKDYIVKLVTFYTGSSFTTCRPNFFYRQPTLLTALTTT
jgi:hypothetical protein